MKGHHPAGTVAEDPSSDSAGELSGLAVEDRMKLVEIVAGL